MDSELNLAKAVLEIRQHKRYQETATTVRETTDTGQKEANVDMVKFKKKFHRESQTGKSTHGKAQTEF